MMIRYDSVMQLNKVKKYNAYTRNYLIIDNNLERRKIVGVYDWVLKKML